MKVAVLSESPADEAAVRILVDAILEMKTEPIAGLNLRSRGWPAVSQVLPAVLRHLVYRTDANALAVVVDSDDSCIHDSKHDVEVAASQDCRLCQLRSMADRLLASIGVVPGRGRFVYAVGLASPCIEAWLRCGLDARVTEAAWDRKLARGTGLRRARLKLKRHVYGTDRPSRDILFRRAKEEAERLAADIDRLERLFPGGFGSFAEEVRRWTASIDPG